MDLNTVPFSPLSRLQVELVSLSGDIDQAELLDALKQINPDADAATVEGMLSFADEDGDRQVSFEEFKQIMVKQKKPPKTFVRA